MRWESYRQFAIVTGDTAQQLTEQLNATLYELRDKKPEVSFEGMIARISYTESVQIPETLADHYEMAGVKLKCEHCPFFAPKPNRDGSRDKRAKWGECPCAPYGKTSRGAAACSRLFEMIQTGEVILCRAESED